MTPNGVDFSFFFSSFLSQAVLMLMSLLSAWMQASIRRRTQGFLLILFETRGTAVSTSDLHAQSCVHHACCVAGVAHHQWQQQCSVHKS